MLADRMNPITARRKVLAAEIETRNKTSVFKGRIKHLSKEEKVGLLEALQEDLGK